MGGRLLVDLNGGRLLSVEKAGQVRDQWDLYVLSCIFLSFELSPTGLPAAFLRDS